MTKSYTVGRLMAGLIGILGWVAVGFGILAIGASLGQFGRIGLQRDPGTLLLILAPGVSSILAGLVVVMLSQGVRALFDIADATRHMAGRG